METQQGVEGPLQCCHQQMEAINGGKKPQRSGKGLNIMFVRPGQQSYLRQAKNSELTMRAGVVNGLLQQIYPGSERFFPLPTTKKLDIVIWCEERLIVHLVELTVPREDNIEMKLCKFGKMNAMKT